jgi:hypothetical protein
MTAVNTLGLASGRTMRSLDPSDTIEINATDEPRSRRLTPGGPNVAQQSLDLYAVTPQSRDDIVKRKYECFYCGITGHNAYNCSLLKNNEAPTPTGIACYYKFMARIGVTDSYDVFLKKMKDEIRARQQAAPGSPAPSSNSQSNNRKNNRQRNKPDKNSQQQQANRNQNASSSSSSAARRQTIEVDADDDEDGREARH